MNATTHPFTGVPVQRLGALTGLRWWAAFMVFVYHMREFAPLPGPITRIFDQGYLGVTFFFVLSGFVLTWSIRPGVKVSTFYWRRFARIWPAHMVALIIAIPVFYSLSAIPDGSFLKPFDLGVLLLSVVLLQGWWANPTVLFSGNPAAWTLTVEMFFYALHPAIFKFLAPIKRNGAIWVSLAAVTWACAYRCGSVLWPESWLVSVPLPITRLPEFVLGMALAWALRQGWRPRIHPFVGLLSMATVVLTIAWADGHPTQAWLLIEFRNELFTVAAALAIIGLATAKITGRSSLFEARWQMKLGTWSFAFYLVHATVIYLALRVFGFQAPSWKNLAWFVIILTIDIALAWLLYRFVEHPIEGHMRRFKDRRDQRRSKTVSVAGPVEATARSTAP